MFSIRIFSVVVIVLLLIAAKEKSDISSWAAPASADQIKNPFIGDVKSVEDGKKLYAQYCAICHGDKGKGDGIAAAGLNPKPADHTSFKVQSQTDGALFWKMTTGRPPMASYEKILSEQQRWDLVNYIRTLKKAMKDDKATTKK